jgi:hypothetical protein
VLEEIFTGSIADNLADTAQIAAHLDRTKSKVAEHNERAAAIRAQCESVRAEMKKLYDLYIAGGIGVEQFKGLNTPLHDRLGQLSAELPKLEGENAALAVSDLSVEAIAHEARNIAALWPTLDTDGKQRLASTLCKEIIIPDKDPEASIEIVFAHSASPKVEAPIRIGAASEDSDSVSSEDFSEISNRLNSQRCPQAGMGCAFGAQAGPEFRNTLSGPSWVFLKSSRICPSPAQVCLSTAQVCLSPAQACLGPAQVYLSPAQVYLSPAQVYLSPAQVYLSPAQVYLSPAQVCLSPAQVLHGHEREKWRKPPVFANSVQHPIKMPAFPTLTDPQWLPQPLEMSAAALDPAFRVWRIGSMLTPRVITIASLLCLLQNAVLLPPASAAGEGWPEGYEIAGHSESPDGSFGVLLPTREKAETIDDTEILNTLVNLKTHQRLGVIRAAHYFPGQSHSFLNVAWAADSSWCIVSWDGRYGFDSITLLEPKGATCTQTELGKHIQQALNAAIAKQAHDKSASSYGNAYFHSGPGRKVLVRATAFTNPKSLENVPDYHARFEGTFDLATRKWTASEARKIGDIDALQTAYSDTLDEGLTFSEEKDRLSWHDERLNEVYAAVRTVLPAERFAAVKKEEIAWLKQLEAADTPAKKCDLIAARIKELRKLVW